MVNKKKIYICTMLAINVILISLISATEYSVYNGTNLSVEYPVSWQVEENNTSLNFSDENADHYVSIGIGEYYPTITILNNYSTFVNGSLDEMTRHLIETLKFKSQVTIPGTGSKENTKETQVISPYQKENAKRWNDRGVDLYGQGKYDEALKCYNKAIELDPQFSLALYNKKAALFALNQRMRMNGITKASLSKRSVTRFSPLHHSFHEWPYVAIGQS
jgi:tetratricopeptide (TPR) repeat protein